MKRVAGFLAFVSIMVSIATTSGCMNPEEGVVLNAFEALDSGDYDRLYQLCYVVGAEGSCPPNTLKLPKVEYNRPTQKRLIEIPKEEALRYLKRRNVADLIEFSDLTAVSVRRLSPEELAILIPYEYPNNDITEGAIVSVTGYFRVYGDRPDSGIMSGDVLVVRKGEEWKIWSPSMPLISYMDLRYRGYMTLNIPMNVRRYIPGGCPSTGGVIP